MLPCVTLCPLLSPKSVKILAHPGAKEFVQQGAKESFGGIKIPRQFEKRGQTLNQNSFFVQLLSCQIEHCIKHIHITSSKLRI